MKLIKLGTTTNKKQGQLSIEFLIILLVIIIVVSFFVPIFKKMYDYTTISFDLANIKKISKEINTICYLGDQSQINIQLNLNYPWNINSNNNEMIWTSEYTKKEYSQKSCINADYYFKSGKYKITVKKNEEIELVIENYN